jgi:hypothetical protein
MIAKFCEILWFQIWQPRLEKQHGYGYSNLKLWLKWYLRNHWTYVNETLELISLYEISYIYKVFTEYLIFIQFGCAFKFFLIDC